MDTSLGNLTIDELLEKARQCERLLKRNNKASSTYYYAHHDDMKAKQRAYQKKYYDIKKAKKAEKETSDPISVKHDI